MLDSQFYATRALASSDGMRTQNRPTREGANVTIAKQLEPENRTRLQGLQPSKVDVVFQGDLWDGTECFDRKDR